VDSSAVVALMQASSRRPVRTFTIGFHESHYNEAEKAKTVARHLGTEHTELYITPGEALSLIPRLPAIYDEPFADSSQVPTCLVAGMARRHVTVSLSGDGGDELFGGYTRYLWGSAIWRRTSRLAPASRRRLALAMAAAARIAGAAAPRQRWPHRLFRLAELLPAEEREPLYHSLVSQWKDPARVVVGAEEPATPLTDPSGFVPFGDFAQRMMYYDTVTYLPDDILVKMDRATMAVSLEGRVPMLDHRLIEFAWRLPPCMKIRQGQGKWLLRQVLYKYVPKRLIERPKMGFAVPIDEWLRGPLRNWASELLDPARLRREGFFRPEEIAGSWREHLAGSRNRQHDLWTVLMFQAWFEEASKPAPEVLHTVSP
jgi:asparagine synthase (glutamine-hydrolysing)